MKVFFRDKFIEYCLKTCSQSEYADKKRRREHNRAMNKLEDLFRKMYECPDRCEDLAMDMLVFDNEKVRLGAGAYCIKAGLHHQTAIKVLTDLKENSNDKMLAFSASCTISFCEPFR